jgi:hypothetical protein
MARLLVSCRIWSLEIILRLRVRTMGTKAKAFLPLYLDYCMASQLSKNKEYDGEKRRNKKKEKKKIR